MVATGGFSPVTGVNLPYADRQVMVAAHVSDAATGCFRLKETA